MAYPGLDQRGDGFRFRVTVDDDRPGREGKRRQVWRYVPLEHCRNRTTAGKWMNTEKGKPGVPLAPSTISFKTFAAQWMETSDLKPSTRKSYTSNLSNHLSCLNELKVQDITPAQCRRVLSRMEKKENGKPYSGRSKQAVLNLLHVILDSAASEEHGILAANPVDKLEKRTRPKATGRSFKRILQVEEAEALLEASANYTAAVAVALFAGLRLSEIAQLRWRHIRFNEIVPVIHLEEDHQMKLKGPEGSKTKASNRDVEMSPRLVELLKAHRRETRYRGPDHFVFCTASSMPIGCRNLSRALIDVTYDDEGQIDKVLGAVARAGLFDVHRPLTFHVLRHNYGSRLISQGVDIVKVSVQMGHEDPAITLRIYAHEVKNLQSAGTAAAAIERAFG